MATPPDVVTEATTERSLVVTGPSAVEDPLVGLATLLPQVLQEVGVDTVEGVHRAVAQRTFAAIPGSAPVRMIHDAVADLVYNVLGAGTRGAETVMRGAAQAGTRRRGEDLPDLESSRAWRLARAVLNGIIGDVLEERDNPLAIQMAVRQRGADVPLTLGGLRRAYPTATPRVAVLLHGLTESDEAWDLGAGTQAHVTYDRVLESAGVTPVRIRYNTGRHISDNALDLADLLDRLVDAWPVGVDDLFLIGHSMGGLVMRGAADVAEASGLGWLSLVRHAVMLGTPHDGASLERMVNAGSSVLSQVPELAPFAGVLKRRSAGIKDLRHGYVKRADWHEQDPDARHSRRASPTDPIDGWAFHNVGATLSGEHDHIIGRIFGDLLVGTESARATGHTWAESATVTHVGGITHFGLLNHPTVARLLTDLVTGEDSSSP